jgi:sigma-54 dependent transcriptional regulator, acetoin dehydrogenase operon transcriptional activator AcoR
MLQLPEPELKIWEQFHGGKRIRSRKLGRVLASWQRSKAQGVAETGLVLPALVSDAELSIRRDRNEALIVESEAIFQDLAAELTARNVTGVLADHEGVILLSRGGGVFGKQAAQTQLIEGARWAESVRGTNAIGTAIAEGVAVYIPGRAHFEFRNHRLFCYAAPIRDPLGNLVGVFDITGDIRNDHPTIALSVSMTAKALERALHAQSYHGAHGNFRAIEHLVERCHQAAILVEAPGRIRLQNTRAEQFFGDLRGDGRTVERLFGLTFAMLEREGDSAARTTVLRTDEGSFRAEVENIRDAQGRVFSVLVFLESMTLGRPQRASIPPPGPATPRPRQVQMFGSDPTFALAKLHASAAAVTRKPVVILGALGSGKRLLAHFIHEESNNAKAELVEIDCRRDLSFGALTKLLPSSGDVYLGQAEELKPSVLAEVVTHFLMAGTTSDRRIILGASLSENDLFGAASSSTTAPSFDGHLCILPKFEARSDKVELGLRMLQSMDSSLPGPRPHDPLDEDNWELAADARSLLIRLSFEDSLRGLKRTIETAYKQAKKHGRRVVLAEDIGAR